MAMSTTVPSGVLEAIQDRYGFSEFSTEPIYSYYGGVFDLITREGQSYILKIARDPDTYKLEHLKAEIEFCSIVKEKITAFVTQSYIPDKEGIIIQKSDSVVFYLLQKHEIIEKKLLSAYDQQSIGKLMSIFHTNLKSFDHPGIGGTSWMREVEADQYAMLLSVLPEEQFAPYISPLDYTGLNLTKTLIHGDWHDGNMSFTDPPFLFDLDTLSYGSPAEEIARTLTHWDAGLVPVKQFYDNLLIGYGEGSCYKKSNKSPALL
ncbi:MAG: serine/threonine protein kinase [Microgenomates bacterium OLB22]|nr:MAG: serine/threonine protein kinase [Microgenomates bacterium OLB22]